jgi:hypothetical protein
MFLIIIMKKKMWYLSSSKVGSWWFGFPKIYNVMPYKLLYINVQKHNTFLIKRGFVMTCTTLNDESAS